MAGKGISLSGSGVVKAFDHGGIWCRRCLDDLGEKRKAHRVMPKSGGRCEEHYREEAGISQRTPEAQAFIDRWKRVISTRPSDLAGADIVSREKPAEQKPRAQQLAEAWERDDIAPPQEQSEPDEAA